MQKLGCDDGEWLIPTKLNNAALLENTNSIHLECNACDNLQCVHPCNADAICTCNPGYFGDPIPVPCPGNVGEAQGIFNLERRCRKG